MVAGFMFLAVSFLALSVDTGRLYLDKRNLQRLADTAALEAAKHPQIVEQPRSPHEQVPHDISLFMVRMIKR